MRIRIRIQGAKLIRILANTAPDSGQTLPSKEVEIVHEKCTLSRKYIKLTYVGEKAFLKGWHKVYLFILINFLTSVSGSGSGFQYVS
jgi:hypothetical protein